jgi:hypothetical protein
MRPYDVFIHVGLLDQVPGRGRNRERILRFLRTLRAAPHTPGDFREKDTSLRDREIKIIGDYAVTYWVDEPVRAVMVVDIRAADR